MMYVVLYLIAGFGVNLIFMLESKGTWMSKFVTSVVLAPIGIIAVINVLLDKIELLWFLFIMKVMNFPLDENLFR